MPFNNHFFGELVHPAINDNRFNHVDNVGITNPVEGYLIDNTAARLIDNSGSAFLATV